MEVFTIVQREDAKLLSLDNVIVYGIEFSLGPDDKNHCCVGSALVNIGVIKGINFETTLRLAR